jgi:hypothetical protein
MITNRALSRCGTFLLTSLIGISPLAAQGAADRTEPAQVLVLGTYHFHNPGLDVVQTEVADVLSAQKQAEIAAVVEAIARFRPTRIAVEKLPASAHLLDSLYAAYRAGRHELSRDETQQLGFRLAGRFGHPRLYAFDHGGEFPFGAVMQYAQTHDPAFVGFVQAELGRITAESNRQQREYTVGEILRMANEPRKLAADHGMYMRFARVGAGDSFVGADLLSKWYDRNIRMFGNLQRMAEPGDRVLVIVGSGHAPILRELVTYDPAMSLVEAVDYLPPPPSR